MSDLAAKEASLSATFDALRAKNRTLNERILELQVRITHNTQTHRHTDIDTPRPITCLHRDIETQTSVVPDPSPSLLLCVSLCVGQYPCAVSCASHEPS